MPLVAPTGLKARAGLLFRRAAVTSLITTQLFTLRYPLVHQRKSLSASAKAGVAIGAVGGAVLIAALLFIFIRRYRAVRAKQLDDRSTVFSGPRYFGPTDMYDRRVSTFSAPGGYHPQSEPPTAEYPQHWGHAQHLSAQQDVHAEPNELQGDEDLHAHHPAFSSSAEETNRSEHGERRPSPAPSGIISPM